MNENRHAESRCERDCEDVSQARAHTRAPRSCRCTSRHAATSTAPAVIFLIQPTHKVVHVSFLSFDTFSFLCAIN